MQGAACAGVSRVGFYGERKSVLFLLIFYNIGGGGKRSYAAHGGESVSGESMLFSQSNFHDMVCYRLSR